MKNILTISLITLTAFSASAKTAHWISANDEKRNDVNTWIEFRQDFNLNKTPKHVEAKIAADTKYWLWINDSLAVFEGGLKRGPNPNDTYYDVVDIAPYLKRGGNKIKVLTCYFGKSGFSHTSSGQSGLIFDASTIDLVSDSTWQSRRLSCYQSAMNPKPNYRLAESNILYDSRLADKDKFCNSIELGVWGDAPWNGLIERPIPQWRNYGEKYELAKDTTIGDNRIYSIRLPYNMQFTPIINVADADGGNKIYIETDHANGGGEPCIRAEYITRKGQQRYESLGWMNGDVLKVICDKSTNISLNSIGYRETGYDTDFEGSFSCNDSTISRFWEKTMRTLYVNMRDNYFDCPDRERAQWWGDATILIAQSFYQLSPRANMLMRKAIHELVDWQKPTGALFSPIPGNWAKELPAQMLATISTYGIWFYYLNTGDEETIKYAYPAIRRYLALWQLDEQGLTEFRKGDWSWGDWGTDIDMRLLLASWHYIALESAIKMAELTGNEADIQGYKSMRQRIYEGFNKNWNGFAYRHPTYNDATDDRVQAMAVLSGLADSTKYDKIFEVFKTQEYASPYMEKYVLEALTKMGHGDYAIDRFKRRFKNMIDDESHTTLFEGWEEGGYGGGSTNHAWSGGMLIVIAENVCGIRATKPAWETFEIHPNPIISQCAIEIPSVKGPVKSSFNDTDTTFTLNFTVPKGTEAIVTLPQEQYSSIEINGTTIKQTEMNARAFTPGRYEICCNK